MEIRKITLEDIDRICEIYNYYVENTAVSFETTSVSVAEMTQRINDVIESGFPYYVGVVDNEIVGYCYLHKWNGRCAYSSTNEVTIYLDKEQKGKGFGTLLFEHLLSNIDRNNTHAILAGICIPNDSSVKLHEKFGFKQVSHMKQIGWKFNQWRDVGHWELLFPDKPKVLILCTGNSCRSQMAHGFLQSFDSGIEVFSAGTHASGNVNPMAIDVMKEAGIDISNHTSDSVDEYLNEEWDYVITVCGGANESCPSFIGKVKNRIHIGFDDPSEAKGTDSYIHSEFVRVRDEIKEAFYKFYREKIKNHE